MLARQTIPFLAFTVFLVARAGDARAQAEPGGLAPCIERCRIQAEEILHRCAGADAQRCRQLAEIALDRCTVEDCRPPDPPTCEDRCGARARDVLHRCLAAGDDQGRCEELAKETLVRCLEAFCEPDVPPASASALRGPTSCSSSAWTRERTWALACDGRARRCESASRRIASRRPVRTVARPMRVASSAAAWRRAGRRRTARSSRRGRSRDASGVLRSRRTAVREELPHPRARAVRGMRGRRRGCPGVRAESPGGARGVRGRELRDVHGALRPPRPAGRAPLPRRWGEPEGLCRQGTEGDRTLYPVPLRGAAELQAALHATGGTRPQELSSRRRKRGALQGAGRARAPRVPRARV